MRWSQLLRGILAQVLCKPSLAFSKPMESQSCHLSQRLEQYFRATELQLTMTMLYCGNLHCHLNCLDGWYLTTHANRNNGDLVDVLNLWDQTNNPWLLPSVSKRTGTRHVRPVA